MRPGDLELERTGTFRVLDSSSTAADADDASIVSALIGMGEAPQILLVAKDAEFHLAVLLVAKDAEFHLAGGRVASIPWISQADLYRHDSLQAERKRQRAAQRTKTCARASRD